MAQGKFKLSKPGGGLKKAKTKRPAPKKLKHGSETDTPTTTLDCHTATTPKDHLQPAARCGARFATPSAPAGHARHAPPCASARTETHPRSRTNADFVFKARPNSRAAIEAAANTRITKDINSRIEQTMASRTSSLSAPLSIVHSEGTTGKGGLHATSDSRDLKGLKEKKKKLR